MSNLAYELFNSKEVRVSSYAKAWRNLIPDMTQGSAQAEAADGTVKKANTLLLLKPPLADTEDEDLPPSSNFQEGISTAVADYFSRPELASYTPDLTHVIVYSRDRGGELFPGKASRGFFLRRGGYPAVFIDGSEKDGEINFQPFVLGVLLADLMETAWWRKEAGRIGTGAFFGAHKLHSGFRQAIGLNFYTFVAEKMGVKAPGNFNEVYRKRLIENGLGRVLSEEVGYDELNPLEQSLAEEVLKGSLVSKLIHEYGINAACEFFVTDIRRHATAAEKLERGMDRLAQSSGLGISVQGEPEGAFVIDRADLTKLLQILGYSSSSFGGVSSNSYPVDERPEGAIAACIINQFHEWFGPGDPITEVPVGYEYKQPGSGRPPFINQVIDSIDIGVAQHCFGSDFDPEKYVMKWRKELREK